MSGPEAAPLRVLFAGTPEIALFSLEALLAGEGQYRIVGVLTNPDRPAGRNRVLTPPPVKVAARAADLPVLQPENLDAGARETVQALKPDLLVVVAYGKIFGPRFLGLFPQGAINLHPSLLPRHRGPTPLQAAILAGDEVTGVTVQFVAPEVDSGAIILQESLPLPGDTTVTQLHDQLGPLGAELLVRAVRSIADGTITATGQDHSQATWCSRITKADGALTWNESARVIERMVRAYTPWPGVHCRWEQTVLQITEAAVVTEQNRSGPTPQAAPPGTVVGVDNGLGILVQTTDGLLALRRLKPQSRKEMDFQSFLNGNRDIIGGVLRQA